MEARPLTVGVVFGGVSPEHEVSVISSLQAAAALDRSRYRPVPVYIGKDGRWYTGEYLFDTDAYRDLDLLREQAVPVRLDTQAYQQLVLVEEGGGWLGRRERKHALDVVFLGLHGGEGENGSLQGLCETFNVPYTGSGVFGSALGMDKVHSKMLCRDQGIPVVEWRWFRESDWAYREEEWLDRIEEELGFPAIVKPARLGSSIGISKVDGREALDAAIEDAFRYDEKVVIEEAVDPLREVNCSVLGDANDAEASVLEEPVRTEEEAVLSFEDKYMREEGSGKGAERSVAGGTKHAGAPGGMASLDRKIPADLPEEQAAAIRELAVRVFQLFECAGVARIDFLLDESTGAAYFNEINTIPGSFSFYLWEPSGVPFDELTHRMIEIALRRHRAKNGRVRSYDVNLLSEKSLKGIKGSKG